MTSVCEVQHGFVDACALELVDVAGEEGERNRTGNVDACVFQLATDEDGYRNQSAAFGLAQVSGPFVDADGADDLLGLCHAVHLRPGRRSCQDQSTEDRAKEVYSHNPVPRLDAICGVKSCLVVVSLTFTVWTLSRCWR